MLSKRTIPIGICFFFFYTILYLLFVSVSVSGARQYGPSQNSQFMRSPNGQYTASAAPYSGQPNNVHYRVASSDGSNRVYFDTFAQYKTPNDVKVGMFSSDSRYFAAAYHYGHNGGYTWIGIWDINNQSLIRSVKKSGWIRDISWVFSESRSSERPQTRYTGPVGSVGGVSRSQKSCEGEGTPCEVHPVECGGRGNNWMVEGTIQCVNGKSQCTAIPGKDYCNRCGGECGGCYGNSCSQSYLCAPGLLCLNYRPSINATPRWECRQIGQGCTKLQNLCWTKEEVGKAQLGCVEGYR